MPQAVAPMQPVSEERSSTIMMASNVMFYSGLVTLAAGAGMALRRSGAATTETELTEILAEDAERALGGIDRAGSPVMVQDAPSTTRRSALQTAALGATTALVSAAAPASAAQELLTDVAQYAIMQANTDGDAALYTPKSKIESSGQKSARVIMSMPSPGPLTAGDYVDVMWFETSSGAILGAGKFRDNGKGFNEPVEGVKSAPVEPKFQFRVNAGTGGVVPCIHTSKGFVWRGKGIVVK
jgi:hypothetical protein